LDEFLGKAGSTIIAIYLYIFFVFYSLIESVFFWNILLSEKIVVIFLHFSCNRCLKNHIYC